jgi:hypothetical protein
MDYLLFINLMSCTAMYYPEIEKSTRFMKDSLRSIANRKLQHRMGKPSCGDRSLDVFSLPPASSCITSAANSRTLFLARSNTTNHISCIIQMNVLRYVRYATVMRL